MDALAAGAGGALLGDDGPVPLVVFKMLLLQHCYGLCDPQCEELGRGPAVSWRRFVGLGLDEPVPDETTLVRFRQRPAQADLHRTPARAGQRAARRTWGSSSGASPWSTPPCSRPRAVPQRATHRRQVWSWDFAEDQTERSTRFRVLTLLDEYTRECLAVHAAWSIRAADVITVVEAAMERFGAPEHIRSDNGPEFIAYAIQDWLKSKGVKTIYITPGSPWENAYIESCHDKLI